MKIYIDESGVFLPTEKESAFSVVLSYSILERERFEIAKQLKNMKINAGFKSNQEIKISRLNEIDVYKFICRLNAFDSTANACVMYMTNSELPDIINHRNEQAELIVANIDKMKYETGKEGLRILKNYCLGLSPQLYAQFTAQMDLTYRTVHSNIPYYIQRDPYCLQRFEWTFDAKAIEKTKFETFLERIAPALIQTRSFTEPLIMIEGYDYSCINRYYKNNGKLPEYLNDVYGIKGKSGIDIQTLLREFIEFKDSKKEFGLQVADILAATLRRCFRNEWRNNRMMSEAIGRLFIQSKKGEYPIGVRNFGKEQVISGESAICLQIIERSCRPFMNNTTT